MKLELLDESTLRKRRGEKWRTYPPDVLPAWVADMDFGVAEPLHRYLSEVVDRSDVGYAINPKPDGLPRVFCERMQRLYGWELAPERVAVLTDVVQGLFIALEVFSQPGEGAVTTVPIYPPFLSATREVGRLRIDLPLVRGPERYELDFDTFDADLARVGAERVRVLMLCHPQNPTGRAFTRAELERLAELALAHDWVVVSDEIHAELVYPPGTHIPFAMLGPEVAARTVTLTSATKAFNIAGLRCAVAAFGSEALQKRFDSIPSHVRGGLGTLGLEATRIAWEECSPWLDEVRAYLQGNRDLVADFVRTHGSAIDHVPPEATYLAWLDCRGLDLPPDPFRFFLREAKVALSPGPAFGPGGQGFVRLNFATARPLLREILGRMEAALERWRSESGSPGDTRERA